MNRRRGCDEIKEKTGLYMRYKRYDEKKKELCMRYKR